MSHRLVKSVGGIGFVTRFSNPEPIVGLVEYSVASASREPDSLAAPKDVISQWAAGQMSKIKNECLAPKQHARAVSNLGELIDDIREIFLIRTSEGYLKLNEVLDRLRRYKIAFIPAERYPSGGLHFNLPSLRKEFHYLEQDIEEMEFARFSILDYVRMVERPSGEIIFGEPGKYNSAGNALFGTLRDLGVKLDASYGEEVLGRYTGLGSERDGLRSGGPLFGGRISVALTWP